MKITRTASRQECSTYGVGADVMLSTYRFLDPTPLGRQRYINEMAMARHVRDTGSS